MDGLLSLPRQNGTGLATDASTVDASVGTRPIIPFLSLWASQIGSAENVFRIQAACQNQTLSVSKSMGGIFLKRAESTNMTRIYFGVSVYDVEIHP